MNSFNTDRAAYGLRVKTNVSKCEIALRIKVKCAIWANTIVYDNGSTTLTDRYAHSEVFRQIRYNFDERHFNYLAYYVEKST